MAIPVHGLKAEVNPGVGPVGEGVVAMAVFPRHIDISIACFDMQRRQHVKAYPGIGLHIIIDLSLIHI